MLAKINHKHGKYALCSYDDGDGGGGFYYAVNAFPILIERWNPVHMSNDELIDLNRQCCNKFMMIVINSI